MRSWSRRRRRMSALRGMRVLMGVVEQTARATSALWCAAFIAYRFSECRLVASARLTKTARWMAKAAVGLLPTRETGMEDGRLSVEFTMGLIKAITSVTSPTPTTATDARLYPRFCNGAQCCGSPNALRTASGAHAIPVAACADALFDLDVAVRHGRLGTLAHSTGYASPRNMLMADVNDVWPARPRSSSAQNSISTLCKFCGSLSGWLAPTSSSRNISSAWTSNMTEIIVERPLDVLGEVAPVRSARFRSALAHRLVSCRQDVLQLLYYRCLPAAWHPFSSNPVLILPRTSTTLGHTGPIDVKRKAKSAPHFRAARPPLYATPI